MNKQINELTDIELQSALLQLTVQRELLNSNIALFAGELIQREEQKQKQQQTNASPLILPKLKKINKEETGSYS